MTARLLKLGGAALVVVVVAALLLARAVSSAPGGKRIALLDGQHNRILGWIGTDRLLLTGEQTYDLRSATLRGIPPPPAFPSSSSLWQEYRSDEQPLLSPDGQWLLYRQQCFEVRDHIRGLPTDGNSRTRSLSGVRFYLTRLDGTQGRWIPARDRFQPILGDEQELEARWLPDSRGWVLVGPGRVEGQDWRATLYRYALADPTTPQTLPLRVPRRGGERHARQITDKGHLVIECDDGGYLSSEASQYALDLVPVVSGRVQTVVSLKEVRAHVLSDGMSKEQLSANEALVLAGRYVPDGPVLSMFNRCLGRSTSRLELWCYPTTRQTPYRIAGVTSRMHDLDFSLAPDSRTLLYWIDGRAYLTAIH